MGPWALFVFLVYANHFTPLTDQAIKHTSRTARMLFYIDAAVLSKSMTQKGGQKMFLVTDLTEKVPFTTKISDAKTVRF